MPLRYDAFMVREGTATATTAATTNGPEAPATVLVLLVLAPGCVFPRFSAAPPVRLPPAAGKGLPLREKEAGFERGLDARHLRPEGLLDYRVRLPEGPAGPVKRSYLSDQACWTGVLLGAECERWAATRDPAGLTRVRGLLDGLALLSGVTGERGLFARYAYRSGNGRQVEPYPDQWHDGAAGYEGWRWRGDLSKDQVAGLLYGLAAVADLVEDPLARARAARLLGDLADRVLGRGGRIEDAGGTPTTYGNLSPRVMGFPVGVNAAILLGLADAAARATGEPRHRRGLEDLLGGGADAALRYPTIRALGKENWNNPNMTALALASALRTPPGEDASRARFRRGAEEAMRRILGLHRGEGNAFWIAVAGPAGAAAGALPGDLEAARAALRDFPADATEHPADHRGRPDRTRSLWTSRRGRERLTQPLRVDEMPASSFCWKNDPYEAVQEPDADGRTVCSGVDFLAAYWPLRRLGSITASE